MMTKQVLFVLLQQFADHEYPFLAITLQGKVEEKITPYEVRTVSVSKDPVRSIGGLTVLPDYSIEDCPSDYAGLILIGGETWRTDEAKKIVPLLKQAFFDGKVVGAICDATVFLGMNGLLNDKKHTSNTLETLIEAAQENYTGQDNYQSEQAVRDGNLITANGTAYLEFAKEVLTTLNVYPVYYIENYYQMFKLGYIEVMKNMQK